MDALKLLMVIWLAGAQCTLVYPRGFKVYRGTKKHPIQVCNNGDLGASWRSCVPRYQA